MLLLFLLYIAIIKRVVNALYKSPLLLTNPSTGRALALSFPAKGTRLTPSRRLAALTLSLFTCERQTLGLRPVGWLCSSLSFPVKVLGLRLSTGRTLYLRSCERKTLRLCPFGWPRFSFLCRRPSFFFSSLLTCLQT